MIATKVKVYSPNFALYKIEMPPHGIRFIDMQGRDIPYTGNGIIGVPEIAFRGWAKGKTGKHSFTMEKTDTIEVTQVRLTPSGKWEANAWELVNQTSVDAEYSKLLAWNI